MRPRIVNPLQDPCSRLAVVLLLLGLPLLLPMARAASEVKPTHPLDPLTKQEIALTARILQAEGKVRDTSRFPIIVLHEPPKAKVLRFTPGKAMRREAFAVVYDRAEKATFEAVVDLNGKRLLSWNKVPGVQPALFGDELGFIPAVVRADPRWRQAIRKRGITDFEHVQVDPWSAGAFGLADEQGLRMVRAVALYRRGAKNGYARPIEGVVAYVDLDTRKVFRVVDTGVVPVSKALAELDEKSVGKLRQAPRPLRVTQPDGASFRLRGHEVVWQNWHFRFAMHPREGLVLYTVGYEDRGKVRPILYRASLSEMVVPYGDPGPGWFFRNAFDMGEFGLGLGANPLELGKDCPANALLVDAVLATDDGGSALVPRVVAICERDAGILWKHRDYLSGHDETRRARQLVVSYIATAGNYEYGVSWIFHQDATLEVEVLMTGVMTTKGVTTPAEADEGHTGEGHGHLVARGIQAVHHQHFFNFRLDMDVDGPAGNSVVEMNTESVPQGLRNPYGNAFMVKETLLRKEQDAQRSLNLTTGRKWKVFNPSRKNGLGQPVGYLLVPGDNAVPYADPASSIRKRAGFLNAHLWVTPYDPSEMNAAGYYVNQSQEDQGLAKWTRANRSVANADVVLWYTMGITHIPRPEEWPVMCVQKAGFKLMPCGFFTRNPALDVPRGRK